MKLLLAVMLNHCGPHQFGEASLIFSYAWAKFANKNKSKIPCDIIFLNQGHDNLKLKKILSGFLIYETPMGVYHSGNANRAMEISEGWDYVILCEHDSFLNIKCLENIYNFLSQSPEINFITTNSTRSWWGFAKGLGNASAEYPWTTLPSSTGLVILKRQLYLDSLALFHKLNQIRPYVNFPFNSNTFTYDRVCKILSKTYDIKLYNLQIGLDGPFSVDFFTCMCKVGINPAEIVNYDKFSLFKKTHVLTFSELKDFNSFKDIIDGEGYRVISKCSTIIAPYLHIGGGYTIDAYWNLTSDSNWISLVHYCLIHLLTLNTCDNSLITSFILSKLKLFEAFKISFEEYDKIYKKVIDFYIPPMLDYLD